MRKLGGTIDGQIAASGTQEQPRDHRHDDARRRQLLIEPRCARRSPTSARGSTLARTASATDRRARRHRRRHDRRRGQRHVRRPARSAAHARLSTRSSPPRTRCSTSRTCSAARSTARSPPKSRKAAFLRSAATLAFSKTRFPLAALIPKTPANGETRAPPTVAFDLNVQAGNDVRVTGPGRRHRRARRGERSAAISRIRNSSGRITSTDGTLSFYRTFVLRKGTVDVSSRETA